ncbi:MAG: cytochrome c oxidase assembly protein [Rhizobiales bacterium]|nr:cytochrome c oxidase assembly protein [Hyphomicrobiales bacterium]
MTQSPDRHQAKRPSPLRDVVVAAACGVFVAAMVGAAYAAVPFYNWFCRVTGFNGTTQVATSAPDHVLDRKVIVRFDANVGAGLPWKFAPEQNSIQVKLGEVATVRYYAVNETARETMGQAAYNVTPLVFGAYFQKINCFCFTEQRMKPGEKRDMTVVFYVDPKLADDPDANGDITITLSYTFYPMREPQRPVAETVGGRSASKL